MTKLGSMFSNTAHLYDAFYRAAGKNYEAEAAAVLDHLRSAGIHPNSILDVACGTGGHLEHFSRSAHCVGVDIDRAMIDIARSKCSGVEFRVADMVELDLGRRFDLVVCLFSSIGYVGTVQRLEAAVTAMAGHVNPGGALVLEPWLQPEAWEEGHLGAVFLDEPEMKGVRLNTSSRRDNVAELDFRYLVLTPEGFESHREHHELTMFSWEQYRQAFDAVGLRTQVDQEGLIGRGLIIGYRPPPDSDS